MITLTVTTPSQIFSYNPEKMHTSHIRWSRIWQVAAIITGIASIAFVAVSAAAIASQIPHYLPLFMCAVYLYASPVASVINYFRQKKIINQKEAKKDLELVQNIKSSKSSIADAISNAYVQYFEARAERFEKKFEKIREEQNKKYFFIQNINFKDRIKVKKFEEIQQKRIKGDIWIAKAAYAKLQAAYVLHVKQNLSDKRPLPDFITRIDLSYFQRLVANDYEDETADTLIKTKLRSYNADDLIEKTSQKLAHEIFDTNQ